MSWHLGLWTNPWDHGTYSGNGIYHMYPLQNVYIYKYIYMIYNGIYDIYITPGIYIYIWLCIYICIYNGILIYNGIYNLMFFYGRYNEILGYFWWDSWCIIWPIPTRPFRAGRPADARPGKHTKNYGTSSFFMGKSTISTGPFSIVMLDYQRVIAGMEKKELPMNVISNGETCS